MDVVGYTMMGYREVGHQAVRLGNSGLEAAFFSALLCKVKYLNNNLSVFIFLMGILYISILLILLRDFLTSM